MSEPIYDPFEFIGKVGIITIAIIGSFITMKFLNSVYENFYEPAIDIALDSEKTDNYYIKIGKYYVQASVIIKEFIKWIILIIILMLVYNVFITYKQKKIEN